MNRSTNSTNFSKKLHRPAVALLNQQCWLWGQDVKREDGNLLLEYGFSRLRPPEGCSGSSQYSLSLETGLRIRLWGFGLYFGGDEGVYINRYELIPRVAVWSDAWQVAELIRPRRSTDWASVLKAFRWIGDYEEWVLHRCGDRYREKCLAFWKRRIGAANGIHNSWRDLAHECEVCLAPRDRQAD